MILISHRGNLFQKNPRLENEPYYILEALNKGYNCEIDIRFIRNEWWLGHDNPQYKISDEWLITNYNKLWIHCKNVEAMFELASLDFEVIFFWHQNDDYTLTSNHFIWSFPGQKLTRLCICVLPEYNESPYEEKILKSCAGICSDRIEVYKEYKNL